MILPPDEYVAIRPLDAAVQWMHDWGIERREIIRFLAITAWASMLVFSGMRHPGDFWTPISVGAIGAVGIAALTLSDEWRSRSRYFNFSQITMREGSFSWVRLSFVVAIILISVLGTEPIKQFDTVFWLIWYSATFTLKPIDKPKHHWRELVAKLTMKTAPGSA